VDMIFCLLKKQLIFLLLQLYVTEIYGDFAVLYWLEAGQRVFNANIEGTVFNNLDIMQLAGGVPRKAVTTIIPS